MTILICFMPAVFMLFKFNSTAAAAPPFTAGVTNIWNIPAGGRVWNIPAGGRVWNIPKW